MDKLTGIHAVKEALEAQRPIEHIVIAKGRQDTRIEEIVQLARKQRIPVRFEDRNQLDRLANSKDHQGVVAVAAARAAATLQDILATAIQARGQIGLIVLLDGVEDPHNLGAIVLGSEGQGLHELTCKRCDFVVSLPTTGPVKSLNVSVAAGVVLFEALRQRKAASRTK